MNQSARLSIQAIALHGDQRRTICFGQLDRLLRLREIRPRDHEFPTPGLEGSSYDVVEVILVGFLAVVYTSEDGVAQVDADLIFVSFSAMCFSKSQSQGVGLADRHQRISRIWRECCRLHLDRLREGRAWVR